VLGCEVWRDLDWLSDAEKVALDVSAHPRLARKLLGVFKSQIAGGKRYDLATLGRRAAHASFLTSQATDATTALTFAMDLTPLTENYALEVGDYVQGFLDRFREDVIARLKKLM
jgi:hypothetical protein